MEVYVYANSCLCQSFHFHIRVTKYLHWCMDMYSCKYVNTCTIHFVMVSQS